MFALLTHRDDGKRPAWTRRHRRVAIAIAALAVAVEAAGTWARGYRVGGNVVARCQRGHLFTTIWIPGGSLKALRLGWWRVQRCPVGRHISIVTPVRRASLTEEELQQAAEHHDIRIP